MSTAGENRPHKLPRPQQIESLTPDQIVAVLLRLGMEISVLRDRLRAHETLLEKHGLLSEAVVDDYQPSAEESKRRAADQRKLIESIIRDLS